VAWPCWHKWTKWEVYEKRYVFYPGTASPPNMQGKPLTCCDIRQKRSCEKCGRRQDELIMKGV